MDSFVTIYCLPLALIFAAKLQPNENRIKYSLALFAINLFYSVICILVPDDKFYVSYLFCIVAAYAFVVWLYKSRKDGHWCKTLMQVTALSIPINAFGCGMWLLYQEPDAYNMLMMVLNAATLFAMMGTGASSGRSDNLGVSDIYNPVWLCSLPYIGAKKEA